MPTYEYQCDACKHNFSLIQTIAEHDRGGVVCPKCKEAFLQEIYSHLRPEALPETGRVHLIN